MKEKFRYCPERELPPYKYIPGVNNHPYKKNGYLFGSNEPSSPPMLKQNWRNHTDYLYAIDLINNGYYWTAHTYLEAIWNANKREGEVAILCNGLIMMCAGHIKLQQNEETTANKQFHRAKELLESIYTTSLCGISLFYLTSELTNPNLFIELD